VIHRAPTLFQLIAGRRIEVAGRFELIEDQTVGFEVGADAPAHPLVIDPIVVYSQNLD
jgi:hypothetical protein